MKMRINWPDNIDRDAADLISRILKYNPEERISLEQMLLHPFFTKFFPNAISSLIKPDKSIKYSVFVVSKDNPLTWNPIYNQNNNTIKIESYENNNYSSVNQNNYNDLYQKYENLKKEYNDLRNAGFSSAALDSLRRELKEKEEKIKQLTQNSNINKTNQNQIKQNSNGGYNTGYNYQNQGSNNINIENVNVNNYNLRMNYNTLVNENYDLKNRLNQYETQYNQQNNAFYLDNNFNEIRNSISTNNTVGFNQAFDKLKTDIDFYTQNNYNTIISMKNQEIENWKKQEKLRKEREDQERQNLINAYSTSLTNEQRENAQLKMRLKELEGYF